MIAERKDKKNGYVNGNYKIEIDWFRGTISTAPVSSSRLFKNLGERLSETANVLVYIDREELAEGGLTKTLAYNLERDPYFQVRLTTNPDASLAENADVVIDGFNYSSPEFLRELEEYDKMRLDVPKQTGDVISYVQNLKSDLQREYRARSLERAVA